MEAKRGVEPTPEAECNNPKPWAHYNRHRNRTAGAVMKTSDGSKSRSLRSVKKKRAE